MGKSVFTPSSIGYQTALCCVLAEVLGEKLMEFVVVMTIFMLLNKVWIICELLTLHKNDIIGQAIHTYDIQHCLQYTGHSRSSGKESLNSNQSPVLLLAISVYIRIFHDFITLSVLSGDLPPIGILISIFLHEILTIGIIFDYVHTAFLILYDDESSSCYIVSEGLHNQLLIFGFVYLLG